MVYMPSNTTIQIRANFDKIDKIVDSIVSCDHLKQVVCIGISANSIGEDGVLDDDATIIVVTKNRLESLALQEEVESLEKEMGFFSEWDNANCVPNSFISLWDR